MKKIFTYIEGFFFREVSATSFGLMRSVWGLVTFLSMLQKWPNIIRFYSEAGMLPRVFQNLVTRTDYHFTLFTWITAPGPVFAVYLLLLLACLCMIIGFLPRVSTLTAAVLLFSFHERNSIPLGGGDTVLRLLVFILVLSPGITSFSVHRLRRQWRHWKVHRALLPPQTMPVWPQYLLLWQMIVLYITCAWDKALGDMWINGSAVGVTLHHAQFAHLPMPVMDVLSIFGPIVTWLVLIFEFSWIVLLIPSSSISFLPWWQGGGLRRLMIALGFLFHASIWMLFDVGSFSPAMMTGYVGLLCSEDFFAIRRFWNGHRTDVKEQSIAILFDGDCGLCRRSVFVLLLLDSLHRLRLVDFRNRVERHRIAPDITLKTLDKALHIRFQNGRTEHGFDALRALAWYLPPLWMFAPFLYLPGIAPLGRRVYARVAQRRKRCTHENCDL